MPHPTAVLLTVALGERLIGESTPRLRAFRDACGLRTLRPVLPAVTCAVQSSMLTGLPPSGHGIVGNGWYDRDLAEVQFWKQSNRLVQSQKVWETARKRDPSVTCAQMFWWYNMYSSADISVTPRPMYKADGRKIPDCYSHPAELRDELQARLGRFPLFKFWGPAAGIESTEWIAEATRVVVEQRSPSLTLVYLPHLDYALQKFGPDAPQSRHALAELDRVAGGLIDFFESRGTRVIIASEYAIDPVQGAVTPNVALRHEGALRVRTEQGHELLDAGASDCFCVADHQIAHVYIRERGRIDYFADLLRRLPGMERVLDREAMRAEGLDHPRAGELVLVAEPDRWFGYRYWLDDDRAPDFARTVDIHRKPGYDPVELFIDPHLRAPRVTIARKLLARKLGFRTLLDVIPLDESLVRGSHGRADSIDRPVLLTRGPAPDAGSLPCTAVRDIILDHLFQD